MLNSALLGFLVAAQTSPLIESQVLEGASGQEEFGWAVASAGDVNNDGYDDVIVGSWQFNGGRGRASVFLGSPSGLQTPASWLVEGEQAGSNFGVSVSGAGDVNGDGFDDIVVGAELYDNGHMNEGRAYIFHGSPSGIQTTHSWTSEGNQTWARFGGSVSGVGDVDNDGFDDVLVGAWFYDNGEQDEGRVFLFYGGSSGLETTASWTAESNMAGWLMGGTVGGSGQAGDLNGDGYADLIVGAPGADGLATFGGAAFVFLGSPTTPSMTPDWSYISPQSLSSLGTSVSGAGDVNGDGYGDLIVGAHQYDGSFVDEGGGFLFLGSQTGLPSAPSWSVFGNQSGSRLGRSVRSAGDVNNDGYDDVVIGSTRFDNPELDEGRAQLFLGSPVGLTAQSSWSGESDLSDGNYGIGVSSAGDTNGDGYADVVVGARLLGSGAVGRVYHYHGQDFQDCNGNAIRDDLDIQSGASPDCNGNGIPDECDFNADSFCSAVDGSLAACPCSNPGHPSTGCDLQQGTGGVFLSILAQETGTQNRVTVQGCGYPAMATPTAIVIRAPGLDSASPVVFGDGLRCIGVPLVRLAAGFAFQGTSVHVFGHGAMAGSGTFFYQLWFRNQPAAYCTPDAFNLSNGQSLVW